jgi:hypothetical protein
MIAAGAIAWPILLKSPDQDVAILRRTDADQELSRHKVLTTAQTL